MAPVQEMIEIDPVATFVSVLIILAGVQVIIKLVEWFCSKFGIELKSQRQKREDHEMLIKTAQKLSELQIKHSEDVAESMEHDKKIKNELSQFTQEIRNSILQTQEQIKQFAENRVSDRAQSFKIQKELQDSQKEISDSVTVISKKLDDMQEKTDQRFEENEAKQNKRVQAELKDQISKIYTKCNASKQASDMEIEVLEGLIATYEDYGGKNSFVHSKVQAEMYTWERVDSE